jgi:Rrf2 family transcriptional regulator, iron-sulfur cluster assembly transcription factor
LARTPRKAIVYSSASLYAIRALVHMSRRPPGDFVPLRHIAMQEGLPVCFLSAIFQRLSRAGLVRSKKGLRGGYILRRDPGKIRLLDVVDALEANPCYRQCAMGYRECSTQHPCPMHEGWKVVRVSIRDYFRRQTIRDLAKFANPARKAVRRPVPV